ncbi:MULTISPECIES: ABC transporter ATP-binding protein [Brucella]|jgi:branched-chain amino acid transport system ATP-binding protein|uniref:ABC transporter ATP-binding protein n=1 Tax=Brucella anthropi TaxID=529 RepID=A0A6I0DN42_BRUAN|nr:ABC transporter ATP-binding protein [Brucella anthropi]KAB2796154.1 ABC transporter ATP-binding protein [Brucella anthropi]MBA8861472.1 branched-chain amino acid transport system ATP-binding protein [Brucella anthropi]MDG9792971.1 ABC transporter ATP-binding protein [Brucella anthropi]MDH0582827.1 ABC transporter ATP-binding protein [Brucella anthropi]MDH0818970.1 ABC transporter ATP-binding protein [Brucella anthropi]
MTTILQVRDLVKRFAGLVATDHVTLDVTERHIHALIGPNGAGKSTLINQLCGELTPTSGTISLMGEDITNLPAATRVGRGLGRTFQISTLLNDMSVRQNIAMAVQAREGHNFRILDSLKGRSAIWREVDAILAGSRLANHPEKLAGDLSSGGRKQLELLMALAGKPKLLLLDEPMAGLGHVESQEMIELLQGLRGKVSMLLVEHDMEAVFALADRISVLVYGRVILTGTVEDIRASEAVREAYLGGEEELC